MEKLILESSVASQRNIKVLRLLFPLANINLAAELLNTCATGFRSDRVRVRFDGAKRASGSLGETGATSMSSRDKTSAHRISLD